MQEVTSRIHQLGSGISQALGSGGHDLSDEIGGISMLTGLRALDRDPATAVIVLVSKPPSPSVAATILAEARALTTPVVVTFLGADPASFSDERIHGAATLAEAADLAVALADGRTPTRTPWLLDAVTRAELDAEVARFGPDQRFLRGIFCGGTFCSEAQLLCQLAGITAASNTPVPGNLRLDDVSGGKGHAIIDMGDDEFTRGRPHPMIDPTWREERVERVGQDPTAAALLVDIVLGYGTADDPISPSSLTCAAPTPTPRIGGPPSSTSWPRTTVAEGAPMDQLFTRELRVVNVGLPGFGDNIRRAGRHAAQPVLVDVMRADDVVPALAGERRILHGGPPIEWAEMCGPVQGAMAGAAVYEGWADTPEHAMA